MKVRIYSFTTALLLSMLLTGLKAQTVTNDYYKVGSGNGKGLMFWSSNSYKIHMGNTSYYRYGPVQDYSIKMNMNNDSDRGWTWGVLNMAPIAALNTQGTMQLKKDLRVMGKVGIGTTSPQTNLHIFNPTSKSNAILRISATENLGGPIGSVHTAWDLSHNSSNLALEFKYGGSTAGASNINPATKIRFHESGKIECSEIEVKNVAADYVFEESYNLRSLQEVEAFISENGHLPDIAPASETSQGVDLGKFNTLLLQKVEELTLYMIELKKENEEMLSKIKTIEN